MKHKKTAKKIIGGLREVDDSEFKYTLDTGRIEFVKAIYPHLDTIINNINAVKWNTYNYTGPDILTKVFTNVNGVNLEENSSTYSPEPMDVSEKVVFLKTVPVYISSTDPIDITYLGGIVYELLNKTYNTSVDLLQYCDPTSDIDININNIPRQSIEVYNKNDIHIMQNKDLPTDGHVIVMQERKRIQVNYTDIIVKSDQMLNDKDDKDYNYASDLDFTFIRNVSDLEGKITPYYQHLTKWMFNKFESCFENENLSKLINSESFYDLKESDLIDYHEFNGLIDDVEQGYLIKKIGKCFLTGFLTRTVEETSEQMYKIQLIAKTSGPSGKYDHLMEMIIMFKYDSVRVKTESPLKPSYAIQKYNSLDNIYHQSVIKLMLDNISSFKERQVFIEDLSAKFIHKAINHVKRMLYLIELFNKNKRAFYETNRFGIVPEGTKDGVSSVRSVFTFIKRMINKKQRFPIKAYQARDGSISAFEFIDAKDILLAYIMLFLYGGGASISINKQYYEKVFTTDIINANIPNQFIDFPKGTNEQIDVFLNSAYTENEKYNDLMSTIRKVFVGGKKYKRKTKKKRIHKK